MPMAISTSNLQPPDAAGELKEVTAAILAGGLGSRLRPAVKDRPKALADVGERPFLTYLFDQLIAAGMRDIVLCTGYQGDQIRRIFGESYAHSAFAIPRSPHHWGRQVRLDWHCRCSPPIRYW